MFFKKRKVSIDLVPLIPRDRSHLKEVVRIFPGFDKSKLQFLQSSKLISNRDGIMVKDENWRLSFSNSECRVLRNLNSNLYKTLKYLASVSGLKIKSYFIKVSKGVTSKPKLILYYMRLLLPMWSTAT